MEGRKVKERSGGLEDIGRRERKGRGRESASEWKEDKKEGSKPSSLGHTIKGSTQHAHPRLIPEDQ
jgi:hypothetical protein